MNDQRHSTYRTVLHRLERGGTAAIERFRESGNGVLFASGALWEGIDIPDTLVKLMQGFGRLIRSETDTGVCVILDIRAGRKGA